MHATIQDQVSYKDKAELVRRTELSSDYVNNVRDLYDKLQKNESDFVALEDDQETDRGSISSSSLHKPLTSSRSNQGQLKVLEDTINVSSLAGNQYSLKAGKDCLPEDLKANWIGIEHFLREQNRDTDPEALTPRKKPFYQRTWFAFVLYGFLLLLLIAAILVIACNQAVIIRNTVIPGQIVQPAIPMVVAIRSDTAQGDSPKQSMLTSGSTTFITTSNPTMDVFNSPTLNSEDSITILSGAKTTSDSGQVPSTHHLQESVTLSEGKPTSVPTPLASAVYKDTAVPLSTQSNSSMDRASSWWSLLSLPGPLQITVGSNNVR